MFSSLPLRSAAESVSAVQKERLSLRVALLPHSWCEREETFPSFVVSKSEGGSVRGMGGENQNVRVKCIGWEEGEA